MIVFEISVGPFGVVEIEWCSKLNLDILTSIFIYPTLKTNYKADFCLTNSSKVLIYLSLLFLLKEALVLQPVDNAIGNAQIYCDTDCGVYFGQTYIELVLL